MIYRSLETPTELKHLSRLVKSVFIVWIFDLSTKLHTLGALLT